MKKSIFLAVAAVAMTACSNDVDLGMKDANKQTADNAIGFEVRNSNMSRAPQELELQKTGHYNFGVWAYKDRDATHAIMANYLVGYFGDNVGYKLSDKQTTYGTDVDLDDLKSRWAYEGLGTSEYKHTSNSEDEMYYLSNSDNDKFYMSNWSVQYLRYWDYSSAYTNFYAYAPYIHGSGTEDPLDEGVVTFDNTNHKMTFPAGTIKDGYNDPSKYEYLYAAKQVNFGEYGKDVALTFKHINSKINITFWEEIEGYKVTMMNLISAPNAIGISAAPSVGDTGSGTPSYAYGEVYKTAGATLTFTSSYEYTGEPTVDASNFIKKTKYSGVNSGNTGFNNNEYLKFDAPTADFIATSKDDAIAAGTNNNFSATTYYAIPKGNNTGLMFHVSFVLTNKQTNETIKVQNATVYVPSTNCNWEAGKRYIYIFKITKNATGETGDPGTIVPGDPTPGTQALYPIVFDGIQVKDWENTIETEHPIN